MTLKHITALLLLLAIGTLTAQQPKTKTETPPADHTDLTHILTHLDQDGTSLSLSDDTDFLEDATTAIDHLYGPAMRMVPDLENFHIPKILQTLGLHDITATGSSSKVHPHYIATKLFIQTPHNEQGLLSILEKPRPFTGQHFAPADTDILIETQLNLEHFPKMITSLVSLLNTGVSAYLNTSMDSTIPEIKGNMRDFISSLNSRVTVIATLDFDTQDLSKSPHFVATIKIDDIATKLWKIVSASIPHLTIHTQGNTHTFTIPDTIPHPFDPEKQIPVTFLFDLDTDQIWITISPDHLKQCRTPESDASKKLTSNTPYKLITSDLPATGCTQFYISKPFTHELSTMIVKTLSFASDPEDPNKVVLGITRLYQDISDNFKNSKTGNGIAFRLTKTKQGIYTQTNAPFRVRSTGLIATILGTYNALKSM